MKICNNNAKWFSVSSAVEYTQSHITENLGSAVCVSGDGLKLEETLGVVLN